MRNPLDTPFATVARNELLLNSKRVAPYALGAFFAANAALWWGWSAATTFGWATNSDFYVVRNYGGFNFLTLPLFNALLMGDPVARDFRLRVDPLVLSTPVSRAGYLLGKFFGSFLTLVCCLACYAAAFCALQLVRPEGMSVLPPRAWPFVKHFFLIVVVTQASLGAFFFAVGSLTRSVRLVYGLAVAFYPTYVAYQLLLKPLPASWRVALDPLLFNWAGVIPWNTPPDVLDRLTFPYDAGVVANRLLVLLAAAACLLVLHRRFGREPRAPAQTNFTALDLTAPPPERIYGGGLQGYSNSGAATEEQTTVSRRNVAIPAVSTVTAGAGAVWRQFSAALGVELRLLRAERSLVVLLPLSTALCCLEVSMFDAPAGVAPSAAYAEAAARALLLFVCGITAFYAVESMHRDRELRVEPVVWAAPVSDAALLLPKLAAVSLASLLLVTLVDASALAVQVARGRAPLSLTPYALVGALLLAPGVLFVGAAAVALSVLLRDKHLAHAACVAAAVALFYLYGQGYDGPLYNPLLYRRWNYADLASAPLVAQRLYTLALAGVCLTLAHLSYARRSAGRRGALLALAASLAAAVVAAVHVAGF